MSFVTGRCMGDRDIRNQDKKDFVNMGVLILYPRSNLIIL